MTYADHRDRAGRRQAEQSAEGRDIGPPPPVADQPRRDGCERDFRRFCTTYFPATFALPFSADHIRVIAKIETAVLDGGLFAMAMPRGSGKTTLAECAALWALLYAHRAFVVLIGAEEGKADQLLASIKVELECNDGLYEDFPEVCYPVRALERIARRCQGQTSAGVPTYLGWVAGTLVLPTIAGSRASGGVAKAVGLTASIRGLKHKRPDGVSVRPDLVIVDDPQTDESARSASQCAYRERVLSGAVLGLAGPGKKIAGIMPCTVIAPGDVADTILDQQKHSEWQGERTRLLYGLPARLDLWDQYAEVLAESQRAGEGMGPATAWYRERREEMDAGAVAAWQERFNPDEASAIQHAMNLRIRDPIAFASEYQNEPAPLVPTELPQLEAADIGVRVNHQPRATVPAGCTRLTAFVDVQQDLLYWMVCGWEEGYTGHVVDYGTYPDQGRPYFRLAEARPTLAQAVGVSSLEGSLWAGLGRVVELLCRGEWKSAAAGGCAGLRVSRVLVDSGWGVSTPLVYRLARQSAYAGTILPSKGVGIGAARDPIDDWARREGERRGEGWVLRPGGADKPRLLIFDANHWKTFCAARLAQPMGERGALALYGDGAAQHRLLADHLASEYRVRTEGRGRVVEEWARRPDRGDNHWWDCLIGCAVAAAVEGCTLAGAGAERARGEKRETWQEKQRRKQAERRREKGYEW